MRPIKTNALKGSFHEEAAASTVQVPGSETKKSAPVPGESDLRQKMPTEDPRPWEPLTPGEEPDVLFYEGVRTTPPRECCTMGLTPDCNK